MDDVKLPEAIVSKLASWATEDPKRAGLHVRYQVAFDAAHEAFAAGLAARPRPAPPKPPADAILEAQARDIADLTASLATAERELDAMREVVEACRCDCNFDSTKDDDHDAACPRFHPAVNQAMTTLGRQRAEPGGDFAKLARDTVEDSREILDGLEQADRDDEAAR